MESIKIVTIIGARPQIIKAAAISRAIKKHFSTQLTEVIVHTGQHYDDNMSKVFFDELNIPEPNYNLKIGSSDHATQTAKMLEAIRNVLIEENPQALLLYGDTNSTLAAALAASKMKIPIIHIEGGLRSFSKEYPEEINRIMTDHVSTLIFTPTQDGYSNLLKEGFKENTKAPYTIDNPKICHCGDIMYDNSLHFSDIAEKKATILAEHALKKNEFVLVTIHRENNTNDPIRLNAYFRSILSLANKEEITFVIPLHPRTSKILETVLESDLLMHIKENPLIKIIPPASFLEIIELEKNAKLIMTDSGGVQKEAFFFKKPALILLRETPWVELVESGCALLVDADEQKIEAGYDYFKNKKNMTFANYYGDGRASEFICQQIILNFAQPIIK